MWLCHQWRGDCVKHHALKRGRGVMPARSCPLLVVQKKRKKKPKRSPFLRSSSNSLSPCHHSLREPYHFPVTTTAQPHLRKKKKKKDGRQSSPPILSQKNPHCLSGFNFSIDCIHSHTRVNLYVMMMIVVSESAVIGSELIFQVGEDDRILWIYDLWKRGGILTMLLKCSTCFLIFIFIFFGWPYL